MSDLTTLQQTFQDYLLNKNKLFETEVTGVKKSFIKQRLNIYSEAYRLRLLDVLKTDFPGLSKWLTAAKFTALGFKYIEAYPSKYYSARDFGKQFAEFVTQVSPYNNDAFIAQFAAFERAISENIDESNAPLLTFQQVAAVPPDAWPQMQLTLHPTAKVFTLNWNIPAIRQSLLTNGKKIKRKCLESPVYWLVWRKNLDVHDKQIDEKEFFILQALAQQQTFADLCTGLSDYLPEDETAQYIVSWLQIWLHEQILSTVSY